MKFEQTKRSRQLYISICFYIQLLILCDVGKAVDDAVAKVSLNESLPFDIFPQFYLLNLNVFQNNVIWDALDQFPHYLLPTNKQKLYVLILGRVQNAQKISIGPLSELDYAMVTKV